VFAGSEKAELSDFGLAQVPINRRAQQLLKTTPEHLEHLLTPTHSFNHSQMCQLYDPSEVAAYKRVRCLLRLSAGRSFSRCWQ
jgi:hypothetical protein